MIGEEFEKSIVALVCWKQMKEGLYRGMISVGLMLRNRAMAGWCEGSIYLNACLLAREENIKLDDLPDSREPQFQSLLHKMDDLFSGVLPDKTEGALYVAHISSQDAIAGEITTQVGQYIFFRGKQ